jgi:hypothetical protein
MKTIIQRLKHFKENNPDLTDLLESKFPEIIDNTSYIKANDLFMRKNYQYTIYQVRIIKGEFKIVNLRDDMEWGGSITPTNKNFANNFKELYLNKFDFKVLLKESGVKIGGIRVLTNSNVANLHEAIFN